MMIRALEASGRRDSIVDSALAWRVLGLLTFCYAFAYVDRQMLNLLVDPIKRSLLISDTQFSLLQGPTFVCAYLLATPIFGRLVDLTNRKNILIFGVCAWSICTAVCGLAHTLPELYLARFGVGVCEACVLPISWSWIGDYFSARRIPRALSIFVCSSQLGGGFALVASGAVIGFAGSLRSLIPSLGSLETWQMAFVVIGAPGLLLALVLLFSVREPPRRTVLTGDVVERRPPIREVGTLIWSRRQFYGRVYAAIGMILVVQMGIPAWFPSFLIRTHGLPAATTGYRLGLLTVAFGSAGLLLGPLVAQWLIARRYISTSLHVAAFATIGIFVSCAAIPLVTGGAAALAVGTAAIFCSCLPVAIVGAATQLATPSRMRGVVASLYTLSAQSLGNGVGLPSIALLTDKVFKNPNMVGYSLQIVTCTAAAIAALLLFTVLPYHRRLLAELADAAPKAADSEKAAPLSGILGPHGRPADRAAR
jgi:MFS transporter, Spinster family, sphingosine-1-phosphate transporter